MNREELLALIDSVLEMNEQGDRSVALSDIRDAVGGLHGEIDGLNGQMSELTERNNGLMSRNQELFLRIGGEGDVAVAVADEPESLEEVLEDTDSLFED